MLVQFARAAILNSDACFLVLFALVSGWLALAALTRYIVRLYKQTLYFDYLQLTNNRYAILLLSTASMHIRYY